MSNLSHLYYFITRQKYKDILILYKIYLSEWTFLNSCLSFLQKSTNISTQPSMISFLRTTKMMLISSKKVKWLKLSSVFLNPSTKNYKHLSKIISISNSMDASKIYKAQKNTATHICSPDSISFSSTKMVFLEVKEWTKSYKQTTETHLRSLSQMLSWYMELTISAIETLNPNLVSQKILLG